METFYGDWSIEVTAKNAGLAQRFIISNSSNCDGIYEGAMGVPKLDVIGDEWNLVMEWYDNAARVWKESDVKRTVSFLQGKGLRVDLGADDFTDSTTGNRDYDFDDLVLTMYNSDEENVLNPFWNITDTFDFTLSVNPNW